MATVLALLAAKFEDRVLLPSEKAEAAAKTYTVKVTKGATSPKVKVTEPKVRHSASKSDDMPIQTKAVLVPGPKSDPLPGPKSDPLPTKGTLSAEQFLLTIRKVTDRNDAIKAIAGYCGYDNTMSFGSQESAARMQAKREMCPIAPAKEEYKRNGAPSNSVQGYIAGIPDHLARQKADLEARERHVVNEMLFHYNEGRKDLALKYKGSITAIRKELSRLP